MTFRAFHAGCGSSRAVLLVTGALLGSLLAACGVEQGEEPLSTRPGELRPGTRPRSVDLSGSASQKPRKIALGPESAQYGTLARTASGTLKRGCVTGLERARRWIDNEQARALLGGGRALPKVPSLGQQGLAPEQPGPERPP
jgi:hypothetical protein